ncbi:hypothetical protein EV207_11424 [Scopulibacillus darangshiensis]|uniref:Spore germination protein GerPA/GerPF n=1 Tax=Scopulibacillus darangshiensis TaxID=442528 RepID=A0A4R2P2P3_9BACL|nr:hypothetical protein [Scopulibacillus darangshiensis]TCP28902.1 hypothetical protein EV207_11424 [Scopulibacillus darangshiensis]
MSRECEESIHFNNLSVSTIGTNSGIFIGNNSAHGWHSSNKSNQGFGSGSGSTFYKTVSMVMDNDSIDTVINDVNQTDAPGKRTASNVIDTIKFDSINVGIASVATSVSVGENYQENWRSHYKENKGFGTASGINKFKMANNSVSDNDNIDNVVNDMSQATVVEE